MSDDPSNDEQLAAAIQALPPEEQEALRAAAFEKVLRRTRVKMNGKVRRLSALRDKVAKQRKLFEAGAFEETARQVPRWQLQESIPGQEIRQGAYKMQLRKWEEAELELDRFGQGTVYSAKQPLISLRGKRRDFAWGIMARSNQAEDLLGGTWAGQDPQAAVEGKELYRDIMRNCHNMELMLVALTSRPLPLAPMRQELAARLERSMQQVLPEGELQPNDKADLKEFISMFDDKRVAAAAWMDKDGCIKEGTHFIFDTTNDAKLMVEAITPGRIREKRTSRICVNKSPLVTAAVFNMFLGEEAIDEEGKKDVGHGFVFVANGFRFRPWEMRQGQYIAEPGPDGRLGFPKPDLEQLQLPVRPTLFQMLEAKTKPLRHMLVGGIRREQRKESRLEAAA